ncbi:MAG: DUF4294 domain-containing protein [Lentimicrobiaceae bacterium]|jgi:hypothetical protein
MRFILVGLLALVPFLISAQGIINPHDAEGYHCSAIVVKGDTTAIMYLGEVNIFGQRAFRNSAESRQWERLVRNVKKAYPYAKLAGIKFNEYNQKIAGIKSEKVQKDMMKQAEDEIEAQFGSELKDLTITQGKILLKLIDRQTNNCSYDIVKDFRGRFRAFFYQSFARLFGYNLKVKYDPLGTDADIEQIVLMIENGSI